MNTTLSIGAMKVLEALAVYQYMTVPQMEAAGVSESRRSIGEKFIPRLMRRRKPLLAMQDFGAIPGKGRLPRMYCLNEHGAEILAESLKIKPTSIPFPKGGVQFANDFFHRVAFVDIHIALRRWVESNDGEVHAFDSYFEKVSKIGSDRIKRVFVSKASVPLPDGSTIIPDGIVKFTVNGKTRLCAIEIHQSTNTARITAQLERHMQALASGAISMAYGHDKANLVLSVFAHSRTIERVHEQMRSMYAFKPFSRVFWSKAKEEPASKIESGWEDGAGEMGLVL